MAIHPHTGRAIRQPLPTVKRIAAIKEDGSAPGRAAVNDFAPPDAQA